MHEQPEAARAGDSQLPYQQTNALPADNMFLGATDGTWGWNANWTVFLLPIIEQTPLYNAYNFSCDPTSRRIRPIGYIGTRDLLCALGQPEGSSQPTLGADQLHGQLRRSSRHAAVDRHDRAVLHLLDDERDAG